MSDYSENTKLNIGDLVLQIHDMENRLAVLKRRGEELVVPLRAIADCFDSNRQEEIKIILAEEEFFSTSHSPRRQKGQILVEGKNYPAFSYPVDLKDLLQLTFETEVALSQLERALQHAKNRAHKL